MDLRRGSIYSRLILAQLLIASLVSACSGSDLQGALELAGAGGDKQASSLPLLIAGVAVLALVAMSAARRH